MPCLVNGFASEMRKMKQDTPPKFNSLPLKMYGWKTILSFWDGLFSDAMSVSGRVFTGKFMGREPKNHPIEKFQPFIFQGVFPTNMVIFCMVESVICDIKSRSFFILELHPYTPEN